MLDLLLGLFLAWKITERQEKKKHHKDDYNTNSPPQGDENILTDFGFTRRGEKYQDLV